MRLVPNGLFSSPAPLGIGRRSFVTGVAALAGAGSTASRAGAQQEAALIRKPIPASGEMVPVIGLGTARRWEAVKQDAELTPLRETLRAFVAGGASVVDTSPTYGTAEAVVGRLAEELGVRDKLFLATKVSISGREAGVEQIEQSFKALRTPKIDLIAVHNLRDTDIHLRTLRDLKVAGRIRYIGVTTSFERQHAALAELMAREPLDFIQVDYALDNRGAAERILPLAKDRGIAVMLNLPFGRGRLFNAVRAVDLPAWAAEFDCKTWPQFFLKYLVSHPAVTCPAPGMARPNYVRDNLAAGRGSLPDAAMRERMEQFIENL